MPQKLLQRWGLVACGVSALATIHHADRFFQAYLVAFLFWFGIAIGCLGVLMLYHVVGGKWGQAIRPLAQAGALTLPYLSLVFLPVLLNLPTLYPWARPTATALGHTVRYLNQPFFIGRTLFYFGLWSWMAYWLNEWTRRLVERPDPQLAYLIQKRSAVGLLLFMLTISFSSFDWTMSLTPLWNSSIYGALIMTGDVLSAFAFTTFLLAWLRRRGLSIQVLEADTSHDLGNLLLAFVMLWAYMAFSQYLIIWYGNLPEEITWYVARRSGSWQWVGIGLILGLFALPFFLLLARANKRRLETLAWIALGILVMRGVDTFWLVIPAFSPESLTVSVLDFTLPIALGSFWLLIFETQLQKVRLMPEESSL